jgi:hypothetical protein
MVTECCKKTPINCLNYDLGSHFGIFLLTYSFCHKMYAGHLLSLSSAIQTWSLISIIQQRIFGSMQELTNYPEGHHPKMGKSMVQPTCYYKYFQLCRNGQASLHHLQFEYRKLIHHSSSRQTSKFYKNKTASLHFQTEY